MKQTYVSLEVLHYRPNLVDIDFNDKEIFNIVKAGWKDVLNEPPPRLPPYLFPLMRVLLARSPSLSNQSLRLGQATVPVPAEILHRMRVSLQDFEALWQNDAGSSTLFGEPRCILLQTPNDGDSFCSMIVSKSPDFQKVLDVIIISSNPDVDMPTLPTSFTPTEGWHTTDLMMVILPTQFLLRHVQKVSETLARLTNEVSCIEQVVIDGNISMNNPDAHAGTTNTSFKDLIKRLHICSRGIVKLRRRWHFQMSLAKMIVEMIDTNRPIEEKHFVPTDEDEYQYRRFLGIASQQYQLSRTLEYDLDVLPTRIANQFNAIFNLMAQSDTEASLKIAIAAKKDNEYMGQIAEATLRDSSSMKTIAILTMTFLPGTFVCSFFSMTMFNWNSQPGERLVSPYIWAYFVAMIPLTLLVLAIWWWRTRDSRRELDENRLKRRLTKSSNKTV